MDDLIKKLQESHGLSHEQSLKIMNTITDYIKEKFPMVSGAVDNLFQSGTTPSGPGTTPEEVQEPRDSNVAEDDEGQRSAGDLPKDVDQKIQDFAKENFSSFFGNKK